MQARKVWEAFTVGICIAAGAAVLLLQGCGVASDLNSVLWGRPAAVAVDANGTQTVVAPATPGIFPPVAESVAAILAALGFPVLALWIRAVSKGAQATAQTVRNGGPKPPQN